MWLVCVVAAAVVFQSNLLLIEKKQNKNKRMCVFFKVPDVRFYKKTGDINKIPWSGLFGTGGYIAPEIMEQQPFGKPADLW